MIEIILINLIILIILINHGKYLFKLFDGWEGNKRRGVGGFGSEY